MADIQPGTNVTIASDIIVQGVVAFARGEQVTVQQVSPNPEMPQYRYTVYSTRAGKWFQLRDEDLITPAPAAHPGAYAQPSQQPVAPAPPPPGGQQPYGAPQYRTSAGAGGVPRGGGASVDFSTMETSDWLVGIGGVIMVVATFFYFTGYGVLFPMIGFALIALVVLDKIVKVPAVADWPGLPVVYLIVGGVGTLLALVSLLNLLFWLHGLISSIWYLSPVLELIANAAVLAGGDSRPVAKNLLLRAAAGRGPYF